MASGGRTPRSDTKVQPDSDLQLLAMPAVPTETQTVATVALMDSSLLQVYGLAPDRAVPECTGTQSTRNVTAVAANTGDSEYARSKTLLGRPNSAEIGFVHQSALIRALCNTRQQYAAGLVTLGSCNSNYTTTQIP